MALSRNGKTQISTIMGDMALVGGATELYIAKTIERCVVVGLPLRDVKTAILNDVKFLNVLCKVLSNNLHDNDMRLSAIHVFPMRNVFAAFFLSVQLNSAFNEPLISTAQYLGVSYRNLQRIVAYFCNEGIIERTEKGYILTDEKSMIEYASGIDVFQKSNGFFAYI